MMDSEVSILPKAYVLTSRYNYCFLNGFYVQSGSRLFGFIGAGATLGQLFGSLFATLMAWVGPCM